MIPKQLYRFRPLDDVLLNRELDALENSYLYSPPFAAMNDPMEAFYEVGGPEDSVIDALFSDKKKPLQKFYEELKQATDKFALISMSASRDNLPLWAYYASNFEGFCLEFKTKDLAIGDLRDQNVSEVMYNRKPPEKISFLNMSKALLDDELVKRFARKRIEWSHEQEWRYITGAIGPKYYVDDALSAIFLGPRIKEEHAEAICSVVKKRPVDVFKGYIRGYELEFEMHQEGKSVAEAERVVVANFDPEDHSFGVSEISDFLSVPYKELLNICRVLTERPNLKSIQDFDISTEKDRIFLRAIFELRNGRDTYAKFYFDKHLNLLP